MKPSKIKQKQIKNRLQRYGQVNANKGRRLKGSFGTYKSRLGTGKHATVASCDLEEVAKSLLDYGNTKKNITDLNAYELALLAKHYLATLKTKKKRRKVKS